MTLHHDLNRTRALAARLPFGLDEYPAVDAAFTRLRRTGEADARRDVDLWSYCYIRRYFLLKALRYRHWPAGEMDLLVDKCFRKVDGHRDGLELPASYSAWVSVICYRTFLNRLRVERRYQSVDDEEDGPPLHVHDGPAPYDAATVLVAVERAIDRLPGYLQETARQRLLHERPYEEIAALLDIKTALARTYTHKALKRLREDEGLRPLRDHLID